MPPPPCSPLFPYTTLFRSLLHRRERRVQRLVGPARAHAARHHRGHRDVAERAALRVARHADVAVGHDADDGLVAVEDRKSTRLNSSHLVISYAVFGLKKKK